MQSKLWELQKRDNLSDIQMGKIIHRTAKQYKKKLMGEVPFNQDEMYLLSYYFKLPIDDIFLDRVRQNGSIN